MSYRREKHHSFWKGFQSAFDLYGSGFERKSHSSNINNSWRNVGGFFAKGFDSFSESNKKEIRSTRSNRYICS